MITWDGAAVVGLAAVQGFPAVSKTTLQPSSRSSRGPRLRPAGWQFFTGNRVSRTPFRLILPTAPSVTLPFTSGIEMKNLPVPGSQTGCSAPLVAFVSVIRVSTVNLPVLLSTLINVANGGESALFTGRRRPSSGS